MKGDAMPRKLFIAFLICLLLAALFTTTALAGKTYRAEHFDVQLELQLGGEMLVTETVAFRFDGVPMLQGTGAGQVEVETGDPLKVA
jgi:hypothetical protein